MAQEASFVHGSTAVILSPGGGGEGFPQFTEGRQMQYVAGQPWTDITGSRSGSGATFHGRAGQSNAFLFSIPTPAVKFGMITGPRRGVRSGLNRIFLLYSTDVGVRVTRVQAFDGGRPFIDSIGSHVGMFLVHGGSGDHSGDALRDENVFSVLVEGVTMFTMPPTRPVFWGVGIQVEVQFEFDGTVRFTAAGADFDVQDS